ncbi:Flp family type IVb pilin [bacterium]|nr:Flp family type IVb pilin [bacterium]
MKLVRFIRGFAERQEGQTLAEYALILVLIAVVVIAAVMLLGTQIQSVLQSIANAL